MFAVARTVFAGIEDGAVIVEPEQATSQVDGKRLAEALPKALNAVRLSSGETWALMVIVTSIAL